MNEDNSELLEIYLSAHRDPYIQRIEEIEKRVKDLIGLDGMKQKLIDDLFERIFSFEKRVKEIETNQSRLAHEITKWSISQVELSTKLKAVIEVFDKRLNDLENDNRLLFRERHTTEYFIQDHNERISELEKNVNSLAKWLAKSLDSKPDI